MTLGGDPEKARKWRRESAKRYQERREERARQGEVRSGLKRSRAPLPRRAQPTTGFRLWVRAVEICRVPGCGRENPDPHHVSARKAGRSRNPWAEDTRNVCPLCRTHHQLGDSPGWSWKRFETEIMGVPLVVIADEVWNRWMSLPEEERAKWEGRAYRINVRKGAEPARKPL